MPRTDEGTARVRPVRVPNAGPIAGVVALAVLVVLPLLLRRGFALVADMTFVPTQPWKGEWLGVDGSVPRAVPADAIVSVVSQVVAGDLVQKGVLLGALVLAGAGMVRLLDGCGRLARFGGAAFYVWNAWVFERLAIGHWGLLVGYAALPWVVRTAQQVRQRAPGATGRLVLWLAVAALASPTGGLLATMVGIVVAVDPRTWRPVAAVAVGAVVVNLPWLVPALLNPHGGSDPQGVRAFAAAPDTPWGTAGSLLSLGGIWKAAATPGDRSSWVLAGAALALVVASLLNLAVRRGHPVGSADGRRLLLLAVISYALAYLPATGAGRPLLEFLVGHLLGAGVLRDSQKLLAPLVLVAAVGFGLLVERAVAWVRASAARAPVRPFVVVLALAPVLVLPSLGWGLAGRLEPVRYPPEWSQVRDLLDRQPAAERRTAVLPWSTYQRFPWNHGRAALDPAIRFFPGQVVTSDDLVIDSRTTVTGEDAAGARIGAAVRRHEPLGPVLAEEGIRFVLLEKTAAGIASVDLPPGTVLHDGTELTLLDLGNEARLATATRPALIVAGDVVTALGLLAAAAAAIRRRRPLPSGRIRRGSSESGVVAD